MRSRWYSIMFSQLKVGWLEIRAVLVPPHSQLLGIFFLRAIMRHELIATEHG